MDRLINYLISEINGPLHLSLLTARHNPNLGGERKRETTKKRTCSASEQFGFSGILILPFIHLSIQVNSHLPSPILFLSLSSFFKKRDKNTENWIEGRRLLRKGNTQVIISVKFRILITGCFSFLHFTFSGWKGFGVMDLDSIECVSSSDGMDEDEIHANHHHHHSEFSSTKPRNGGTNNNGSVGPTLIAPATSVHELLECPVCTNSMYPPIHQACFFHQFFNLMFGIFCWIWWLLEGVKWFWWRRFWVFLGG